jgi:hypothetical protein
MFKFINPILEKLKPKKFEVTQVLNGLVPEASLPKCLELTLAQRVMVFAPHPDDECIGCGGTLALLAQRPGVEIKVVLVTNGDGGAHSPEPEMGPRREQEMINALQVLGIESLDVMGLLDGRITLSTELTKKIEFLLNNFKPNWIFLPSPLDYHKDHLLISHLVSEVAWAQPEVEQLVYFETWCPVPATHTVDITSVMDLKVQALSKHQTAMKYGDYIRCIQALNAYRGLYLGFGRYAEAFLVQARSDLEAMRPWISSIRNWSLSLKQLLSKK